MIKIRTEDKSNYKGVWFNGKTIRFAIDPSKPILELEYPEFYDIKITDKCSKGKCHWCYMNSKEDSCHYDNIIQKTVDFFGSMTENQKPFQVTFGGGEPTEHPYFLELLKITSDLGISPSYTTNGTFENKEDIIEYTKRYCGGVAVSCHNHLRDYWTNAANLFIDNGIRTNFHLIISDKESIDRFIEIYNEWKDKIDYFVLLPMMKKGRSNNDIIDWEYLKSVIPDNKENIAFGANFYPYLQEDNLGAILYEPEIMSKFLDLKDMKIYKSSFCVN